MKHLLLVTCLVSLNALQASMAAVVLKPEIPSLTTSESSSRLAAFAAPEAATKGFAVAPITPDLSTYRSAPLPTLASANCFTFFYNVGGIWMSQRYCW